MLLLFVSPHLRGRELARSRANSQTSNLPPIPHILTRHRSNAELRVVGIETSRTESLTEEPSPESNNLAMSRLRTREMIISPCVGLAPSLINVCTRKKRNSTAVHSSTAVIAHGFWAHIESIPWTTSNRQTSKLALRRGGEERLELLVTFLLLGRTASDPSTTAWLNPLSSGSKIDQPQKKCPPRAQPPSDFRDTSHRLHGRLFSLAQGQQRCARSNLCALPRRLGAMTQGVWSLVQKLKKGGVMGELNRCCCSIFCPKIFKPE